MKYLWSFLLWLGFVASCLQCARRLNVVMATDTNYAIPTAVTMKSLIDAERGSNADLYFVIFVDKTTSQKAGVWSSFHNALLTQMGTANPKHVKVCLVDVANIEDRLLEKAAEKYGSRLIALRLVFPKIWKNQELPEFDDYDWLNDIKEFLWLDSDVLVMKPLEPLLDEVGYGKKEGICQPIISANLDFIYSQNDIPRRYHNYQIWSHSGVFAKESVGAECRGSAHVSGGVVFLEIGRHAGGGDAWRNNPTWTVEKATGRAGV